MNPSEFEMSVQVAGRSLREGWRVAAPLLSILAFCLLITLAAFVRVPVPGTEVPMTLQVLAVLLTGFALTPRRAAAATFTYLACGAVGLPVFASPAGLSGPTAGYLVGFLLCAWLVSALKGEGRVRVPRLLLAGAAGVVVVFALGIAWRLVLARLIGLGGGDLWFALTSGFVPFAGKTVVELLLAVTMVVSLRGLKVGRRRLFPSG